MSGSPYGAYGNRLERLCPFWDVRMDALLFRLRIFTETHFAYEETVLRLIRYPDLERHRQTHAAMIEKTKEVIAELSRSQDYHALLHFLRDWWLGHIQGVDKLYISYVEKLGL